MPLSNRRTLLDQHDQIFYGCIDVTRKGEESGTGGKGKREVGEEERERIEEEEKREWKEDGGERGRERERSRRW